MSFTIGETVTPTSGNNVGREAKVMQILGNGKVMIEFNDGQRRRFKPQNLKSKGGGMSAAVRKAAAKSAARRKPAAPVKQFKIQVPAGAAPGMELKVNFEGKTLAFKLPPGTEAGSTIVVQVTGDGTTGKVVDAPAGGSAGGGVDLGAQANQLFNSGNMAGALAIYDQILAQGLAPKPEQVHRSRAAALQRLNRLPEALAAAEAAIKLDPSMVDAYVTKAFTLMSMQRLDEAVHTLGEALALDPSHARARRAQCNVLNVLGRHEEALAKCAEGLALAPTDYQLHVQKTLALINIERFEDLKPECEFFKERWHRLGKDAKNAYATALVKLALDAMKKGAKKEAIDYFSQALEVSPNADFAAIAAFNRGVCFQEMKKMRKAMASFALAAEKDPQMTEAFAMVGQIRTMKKEYFKAMEAFRQVGKTDGGHSTLTQYNWGVACYKTARKDEAREHFNECLAIDPNFQPAKDALEAVNRSLDLSGLL